ncbi:MAG: GAF domain-containing protein [Microcystaceae cyanobacterium]
MKPLATLLQKFTRWNWEQIWRCFLLSLMVLGIGAGIWATHWRIAQADQRIREHLQAQTVAIAHSIKPSQIATLTFTAEDRQNPYYQRLQGQMRNYAQSLGYRSIYTIALRGQNLVFGPENFEPDDPLASPPGTLYRNPPPQLFSLFEKAQSLTLGPYRDEYGEFISAFTSVVDHETGTVILVVGMDKEMSEIRKQFDTLKVTPFLLTLAWLAVVGWGYYRLIRPGKNRRWNPTISYLTALMGLIVTLSIAGLLQEQQTFTQERNFDELASLKVERISRELFFIRDTQLPSLGRFLGASQSVSYPAFQAFTDIMARNRKIQAWEWIPQVKAEDKTTFEAEARRQGLTDFTIFQRNALQQKQPVQERDYYYPVYYVAPRQGNEPAIGFDLGSDLVRRQALLTTLQTRLPTATSAIQLIQDPQTENAILVYYPVFDQSSLLFKGFALVVLRLQQLLSIALAEGFHTQYPSDLVWLELQPDRSFQLLADSNPDHDNPDFHDLETVMQWKNQPLVGVYPLFIFGKTYAIAVFPNQEFWHFYPVNLGQVSLGIGLGLTALLTILVTMVYNQRAWLEQEVKHRTQALNETTYHLGERVKEMKYLVTLTRLSQQSDLNLNEFLQTCVDLLPSALQYPALGEACLCWGDRCYLTVGYRPTPWQLQTTFQAKEPQGVITGQVTVSYREEHPFLLEEEELLQTVAQFLSYVLESHLAENILKSRERNYREIFNSTHEAILVQDAQTGLFTDVNQSTLQLYGYDHKQELIGQFVPVLCPQPPETILETIGSYLQEVREKGSKVFEWLFKKRDGTLFWGEVSLRCTTLNGQAVILAVVRDIDERKRQAQKIQHLSRLYSTLRQVNRAIIQYRDRDRLFQAICDIGINIGNFSLIWFGLIDAATDSIRPHIAAGPTVEYLDQVQISLRDEPIGRGPTGTAARENRLIICADIDHDSYMAPWREKALHYGLRSSAAVPIHQGSQVIGVLTLYASEVEFFNEDEQDLLQEIGDNISFALEAIQRDLERQAVEQKLRENEKKLQEALVKNLSDRLTLAIQAGEIGIWEWNPLEGLIWDEQMYKIYGLPQLTPVSQADWLKQIDQGDRPRVETLIEQHLQSAAEFALEFRIQRPDGQIHWIQDMGLIQRDDQGQLQRIVGINQDITERKQAEIQLQHQAGKETLLREITQRIRQTLDLQTTFATACQEIRRFVDADRVAIFKFDPASGHNDGQFVAESVREGLSSVLAIHIQDHCFGKIYSPLYTQGYFQMVNDIYDSNLQPCHRAILERFDIRANLVMPLLCGEELWGLLCTHTCHRPCVWQTTAIELTRQITLQLAIAIQQANLFEQLQQELQQRQQAEQALRESNEQLAISNEQLWQATRLKDEFLANMSHELRTPLNAILGMNESLREEIFGAINEKQLKALNLIESSSSHLLSLVNDILDLAKIESGQVELQYNAANLEVLCQDSMLFIAQQALKKQIQLQTLCLPNLPDLWIDERRIRQALINLLNNAVKFTPEGGQITLEVSLLSPTPADGSEPWLTLAVRDTGIGIAPENVSKLFQPFVQIDSALNRKYEGTGLGLALVKRIVELHGGRISLTTELGVGSCFQMELPYRQPPDQPMMSLPTLTSQSVLQTQASETPPLILLAEDNPGNLLSFSCYLEAKGYRLVTAEDGKEAIAQAEQTLPDLILMDIQMPGMDGLEAIQQLRGNPHFAQTPIIALTALAMPGDQERCLAAGANEYLAKPIKLRQLAMLIEELLQRQEAG